MELSETSKVSDTLIQIQNKGKTTVDALSKSMGAVIPTAAANSVSVQQLGASYAILTANGIKTEQTGTIIKAMFAELGKSGTIADKALRKLSGKGFKGLIDEGKTVADVLLILEKEATANGKSLSDMFGSVEAGTGALSLLSKGTENYDKVLAEMSKTGAAQTAADQIAATAKDKLASAWNKLKNAGVDAGEKLVPLFVDMVDGATNMIDKFTSLDDKTQKVILAIGGFVAVGVPLLGFTGMALTGLGSLATLAGTLAGALGITTVATTATTTAVAGTTVATTGLAVSMSAILAPLGLLVGVFGLAGVAAKSYTNYLDNEAVQGANHYISKLSEVGKGADKLGQDIATLETEHNNTMIDIMLGGDLGDRLPQLTADLKSFYAEEAKLKEEKLQKDIDFNKQMIESTDGATKAEFQKKLDSLNKQLEATKAANSKELKNTEQHFKDISTGKAEFNETDKAAFQAMHEEKITALIENNEAVKEAVANGDKNIDEIRQAARDTEVAKTIAHLSTTRETQLAALEQEKNDKITAITADKTLSDTARSEALLKINANYLEDKTLMQTNFAEQLGLTEKLGSDELALYDLRNGKLLTTQQQNNAQTLELTRLNNAAVLAGLDLHYQVINGKTVSFTSAELKQIESSNTQITESYNKYQKAHGLSTKEMESQFGSLNTHINKNKEKILGDNQIIKDNYSRVFNASGMSLADFEACFGTLNGAITGNKSLSIDANGNIISSYNGVKTNLGTFEKVVAEKLGNSAKNAKDASSKTVSANGLSKTSFNNAKTSASLYSKEIDTVNSKKVKDKTATFTMRVAGKSSYNAALAAMSSSRPVSFMTPTTTQIIDTVSPRFTRSGKSDSISDFGNVPKDINFDRTFKVEQAREGDTTNNININFDKVEIKNNDSYEDFAKKAAKYLDIELNKLKNKNKKMRGGSIYA